ncbi:serine hydrolase-like protein [Dinothrombium tinctorium]|uniref:Serine hydrolase-like protein n=1 Tax=Dinothrombium tinctorium TaxID=1965070 RepID=A0A3S3NZ99_9ACAR|nr:serine hydrolase-like protein [Dinothrombium tinctorium]
MSTLKLFTFAARKTCHKNLIIKNSSPFSANCAFNICRRQFSNCGSEEGKEIRVPTPYGHIACKEYGNPNGHPVLAIHGWMDNCGSFEPLIPLIIKENNLHIVAIDETGCGLSSHLPPGVEIQYSSLLKDMRRVTKYLNWEKFSLIGHSRGGVFSIFFASIFPQLVQSVTAIDVIGPFITRENYPYTDREEEVLEKHLKFDELYLKNRNLDETAPIYTETEAIKRILTATPFGLSEKDARILMKRGTKPYKNGLIFTRDLRFKLPVFGFLPSINDFQHLLSRIKCDLLLLIATEGINSHLDNSKWIEIYRSKCRTFEQATVEGKHYIHMDNAEIVASFINPFLKNSLRKGPII